MTNSRVLSPAEVLSRIRRPRQDGVIRSLDTEYEEQGFDLDCLTQICGTSQGHVGLVDDGGAPQAYIVRGLLEDGRRAFLVVAFLPDGTVLVPHIEDY
jgi:hypothetical protein